MRLIIEECIAFEKYCRVSTCFIFTGTCNSKNEKCFSFQIKDQLWL